MYDQVQARGNVKDLKMKDSNTLVITSEIRFKEQEREDIVIPLTTMVGQAVILDIKRVVIERKLPGMDGNGEAPGQTHIDDKPRAMCDRSDNCMGSTCKEKECVFHPDRVRNGADLLPDPPADEPDEDDDDSDESDEDENDDPTPSEPVMQKTTVAVGPETVTAPLKSGRRMPVDGPKCPECDEPMVKAKGGWACKKCGAFRTEAEIDDDLSGLDIAGL